jgi:hypothetical protein
VQKNIWEIFRAYLSMREKPAKEISGMTKTKGRSDRAYEILVEETVVWGRKLA